MKNIYIIDYIGRHGGTDRYLSEYQNFLKNIQGVNNVTILSNYASEPDSEPFFIDHYKGRIWNQVLSLYRNYHRLSRFIDRHPDDIFIYMAYGNGIDIHFIRIAAQAQCHIIDLQASLADNYADDYNLQREYDNLFLQRATTIICHNDRIANHLSECGFTGLLIKMPSFNYNIFQDLTPDMIANDFKEASSADDIPKLLQQAKDKICELVE